MPEARLEESEVRRGRASELALRHGAGGTGATSPEAYASLPQWRPGGRDLIDLPFSDS